MFRFVKGRRPVSYRSGRFIAEQMGMSFTNFLFGRN